MNSNKKIARIAGLLYLIVVVTGIISLAYVPSKLIVWNDASKTYTNIVDNEMLFRIGILCGLICYTTFVVLPIALYKLLNPVNNTYALLMVVLAVASVPVSLINIGNKFSVLTLIHKASELKGVKPGRIQEQVLFQLHLYNNGNQIASIFWGLWLLPFGYLVFKSAFLPKFLGICLMIGCFGYLIDFTGDFLFRGYSQTMIARFITIPGSIGEIGICLWLVIIGTKASGKQTIPTA